MSSAAPAVKTNVMSIVGMVLSLFGLLNVVTWGWFAMGFGGLFSVAGVIISHIAMKQLTARGEGGRPLALTGIITGWIGVALGVIQLIIGIVFLVALFSASTVTY